MIDTQTKVVLGNSRHTLIERRASTRDQVKVGHFGFGVGRNLSGARNQITVLAQRIEDEMRNSRIYNGYIDKLQYLISNREDSTLKGLHEKLKAVGRGDELKSADRDLLAFEQMLDKYTHYQSAQILFARLLIRILTVFEKKIMPPGLKLSRKQVDEIIDERIIQPTMADMDAIAGRAELFLDEGDVYGMVNWLTCPPDVPRS